MKKFTQFLSCACLMAGMCFGSAQLVLADDMSLLPPVDTIRPIVSLKGSDTICHTIGQLVTPWVEPGAMAIDDIDPEAMLQARMTITWTEYPVDSNGRFYLKNPAKCAVAMYATKDSAGNVSDTVKRWYCNCINARATQVFVEERPEVYPNPVNEQLHVVIPENSFYLLTVADIMGHILFMQTMGKPETIDLSYLPAGLYIYQLKGNGKLQIGKLLKE